MKVLIMVVATRSKIFDQFYYATRKTWNSQPYPGTETIYYYGNGNNKWEGDVYSTDQSEDLHFAALRFQSALKGVWTKEWDIVFRTSLTCYINKKLLHDLCKTLPVENLYGGHAPNMDFVSGAGIFISRDIAEILKDNIDHVPTPADDCHYASLLRRFGKDITYTDNLRYDITEGHTPECEPTYHYRIKSNDRERDVQVMYELHNKIMSHD